MSEVTTGPWERRNQLADQIIPGALYVDLLDVFQKAIDRIINMEAAK